MSSIIDTMNRDVKVWQALGNIEKDKKIEMHLNNKGEVLDINKIDMMGDIPLFSKINRWYYNIVSDENAIFSKLSEIRKNTSEHLSDLTIKIQKDSDIDHSVLKQLFESLQNLHKSLVHSWQEGYKNLKNSYSSITIQGNMTVNEFLDDEVAAIRQLDDTTQKLIINLAGKLEETSTLQQYFRSLFYRFNMIEKKTDLELTDKMLIDGILKTNLYMNDERIIDSLHSIIQKFPNDFSDGIKKNIEDKKDRWKAYVGQVKKCTEEELKKLIFSPLTVSQLPVEDIQDLINITKTASTFIDKLDKEKQFKLNLSSLPQEELLKIEEKTNLKNLSHESAVTILMTGKMPLPQNIELLDKLNYPELLTKISGYVLANSSESARVHIKDFIHKLDSNETTRILRNNEEGGILPDDLKYMTKYVPESLIVDQIEKENFVAADDDARRVLSTYKRMLPFTLFTNDQIVDYFITCFQAKDFDPQFFYDSKIRLSLAKKSHDLLSEAFKKIPLSQPQKLILEQKLPISIIPEEMKTKFELPEKEDVTASSNEIEKAKNKFLIAKETDYITIPSTIYSKIIEYKRGLRK